MQSINWERNFSYVPCTQKNDLEAVFRVRHDCYLEEQAIEPREDGRLTDQLHFRRYAAREYMDCRHPPIAYVAIALRTSQVADEPAKVMTDAENTLGSAGAATWKYIAQDFLAEHFGAIDNGLR